MSEGDLPHVAIDEVETHSEKSEDQYFSSHDRWKLAGDNRDQEENQDKHRCDQSGKAEASIKAQPNPFVFCRIH